MARILLLAAIGFVIWLLFRSFFRAQIKEPPASPPKAAEDMVACARCGVNLPRSEAREEGGQLVCADPAACKRVP